MNLAVLILAGLLASRPEGQGGWRVVETAPAPGAAKNHGGFLVESSSASDDSPRLRVQRGGRTVLTVQPEGGLVRVAEALKGAHAMPSNRLASAWVYSPRLPGGQDLFMVFGRAFTGDPGSLRVFRMSPDSPPKLLYTDNAFELEAIVEAAGHLDLVGRRSFTQMTSRCEGSYDPFLVLRVDRDGAVGYSAALSQSYNLTHGYVWRGPQAREDVRVNVCSRPARVTATGR
jgi:hypothetical protein